MQTGNLRRTNGKYGLLSAVYNEDSSLPDIDSTNPSCVAVEIGNEEARAMAASARLRMSVS